MARRSQSKHLAVWMNGIKVGDWHIDARGQHTFHYEQSWANAEDTRPLSLSMPVRSAQAPYRGAVVERFFDNLLPDSTDIRRRLQTRFNAASTSAFDLLVEIGRECVGAIQLLAPHEACEDVRQINAELLDEEGIADHLRSATSSLPFGQRDEADFRISIAGTQEKSALLRHQGQWYRPEGTTPTTHIFKLPLGRVGNMQADLSTSVENEWLCSQILREFGLPVANCDIATFSDQHVLVVERFDRRLASNGKWWIRLPQEDMCQATGTSPLQRYQADGGPGISAISAILLGSRNAAVDRRVFFKGQVLFWMLCAPDGHAKNFSLFIEPYGRYSLTPIYDVISAYPFLGRGKNQLAPQKVNMAMAVSGKNHHYKWSDIQPRHWMSTATRIGLKATFKEDIAELIAQAPDVIEKVSGSLPINFPETVSEPIFKGVLQAASRLENVSG